MQSLKQILYKCKTQNHSIISIIVDNFKTHLSTTKSSPFLSSIGIMTLSILILLSVVTISILMYIIGVLMILELLITRTISLFSNSGIPGWNIQYLITRSVNKIKNVSLRKKPDTNVEDEEMNSYYSEMPWGIEEVAKYNRGITSEEQLENIRKIL
jgi:hypothetical protein